MFRHLAASLMRRSPFLTRAPAFAHAPTARLVPVPRAFSRLVAAVDTTASRALTPRIAPSRALVPSCTGARRWAAGTAADSPNKFVYTLKGASKVLDNQTVILKPTNVSFLRGAKIGVIGNNGSGKSTLLRIMAGIDTNYLGEAFAANGVRVGFLQQEPVLDENKTVMENIMDGLKEKVDLLTRFEEISNEMADPDCNLERLLEEQAQVQALIDAHDAWNVQRDVEMAMQALHCPPGDSSVVNLSGGERRRVALCRLLMERPDMLLLDEPTNHLDAASVAWLERFLAEYKGTVLAVTHDRYFLDNVADWILEIDRGDILPFHGNYSQWLEAKRKRMDLEKKQDAARAKLMDRELQWMRTSPGARRSKSKARLAKFEEMAEAAAKANPADKTSLIIPPGPRLGTSVLEVKGLSKSYGDQKLIDNLSFRLDRGAIIGVVGTNGSGKSTLFRILTGEEEADSGHYSFGQTVKLGHVAQSRDSLHPDKTVYEEIAQGSDVVLIGSHQMNVRAYVAQFNFKGQMQEKLVKMLSGGERNRVHLAKLLKGGYNVILLDEPTNDLDVDTLRALEESLPEFVGSVIVISHDRYFLDRVCSHTLAFEGDGEVNFFEGTYSEYERDRKRTKGKTLLEEQTDRKYAKVNV